MSYEVTYGDAQTYTRAYKDCSRDGALYVSTGSRLTPTIKRAIVAHVTGQESETLSVTDVNLTWARLPMSMWESVTLRPVRVESVEESYLRIGVDYTHTRGSGELEPERVKFLRV